LSIEKRFSRGLTGGRFLEPQKQKIEGLPFCADRHLIFKEICGMAGIFFPYSEFFRFISFSLGRLGVLLCFIPWLY